MKTFRLFAALLVVALLPAPAFPQDSSEITALLAPARRGNGIAQYNLGLAYAEGKGVAADPIEAYVWLSLARENGARGRALDNLTGALDKNSLELAQRRLTERKAELASIRPATPAPVRPAPTPAAKEPAPAPKPAVAETPAPLGPLPAADTPVDPAELAALRAERDRLAGLADQHEKAARAAEAKVVELTRTADATRGELTRVRMALTAAQKSATTARPAAPAAPAYPDLTGRVAELENAYTAASTSLAQAQAALAARSAAPAAPAYPDLRSRVTELETQAAAGLSAVASAKAEAERAKQEVAALTKAKEEANASLRARPAAPDSTALDQKTRELQAALTELEEARTFGRQVEDTLNKVNDEKTRVAAAAAAELAEARTFGTQVESTLNKVSDQKAALETALRAAEAARDSYAAEFATARSQLAAAKSASPAAPAYPDLSGKVADLESKLAAASAQATNSRQEVAALTKAKDDAQAALAARPAAPAYPDLRSRITELETQVAADSSVAASAKAEAARAKQEVTALTKARDDAQAALAAKPTAPAYPNLSGKVTELEAALAAQSSEATRAKQEVAALTKARDDAQAALAAKPSAPAYPNLSGKVAELESALATQSGEATRAKQEVAALTKARDDAQAALAAKPSAPAYPNLAGKVTELETALAASAQKATAAEQARTEVAKQFDDYKSSTAAAQRERTTLLASVKLLESDKVSLRRQADSAGAETDQLRTQVASLKEQLSAKPAAPSYPNLSGKVTELETALAQAKAAAPAYPDLRGRVTGLEADLTTARQLLAAKSAAPAYPDLSAKVAELETALANSTRQVAAAATEADRAKREVAQLNKTIAETPKAAPAPSYPDYTNHVKELTAEASKLRADHAQLQQSLAAAERKSSDLSAEAARAQQEVAALLKAKDERPAAPAYPDLRDRVAQLEREVAAKPAAPAYPDLRGKVGELETQLTNLSSAMSVAMSSKTEALAKIDELTKANESARARTAELQAALTARPAAPAYPDLSARVSELETAYTASSTSLAQAQAALAARPTAPTYPDLSGRVKDLETQLAQEKASPTAPDLSGRVTELETALADSARKLVAADKTQADLRQELAATENASKVKSDYVVELEGKLRRQTATAKADPQLQREHQELTTRVASLSGEVTQLREDRERMQKLIADSGRRLRDSTADASRIKELETQVAAGQTALSAAKAEASQASARTAELQTALAAKPAAPAYPDVRNQVAELRGQLTALSAEAEHAKQQLAASTKAREASQTQINLLETQLAEATAKPRTPAYPDLSRRVAELETQVASDLAAVASAKAEANRAKQEVAALNKAKEEASSRPAAPTYPDLSGKVAELETRLTRQAADLTAATAAKAAADQQVATLTKAASQPRSEPITAGSPTFPNLSLRVRELEGQLATATADAQRRGQQLADLTKSSETTQRNLTREIEAAKAALAKPAAPAYPDLSGRVAQLERDLTAARAAAPAYPDLSGRVAELENRQARLTADLSAANSAKTAAEQQAAALASKPSAPAYPDLRSRVAALETQAAADSSAAASAKAEAARAKQELAAFTKAQPAAPSYPDLRERVDALERDLAAARNARPAAPAYPDLRNQVTDLRGQLTALTAEDARTKQQLAALTRAREEARPPAYPDLRSRVAELEGQLAQVASQPAAAPAADDSDLQKRLADTEDRLATALRGYALLERDRDAVQARSAQASEALAAQVATLTAQVEQLQSSTATQASTTQAALAAAQAENTRLSESLAALQRSTGQATGDAASARALVQQLQGANAVLAQENYQLKTTLSRSTGGAAPTRPAGALTPVAAARIHVVASGDSLSALSQRYYGTAGRWQEIYNANAGKLGPNGVLRIGTELRIP